MFDKITPRTNDEMIRQDKSQKPFTRTNIFMMLGCIAMIVVGFVLMMGPGSSVETGFNPDIFSTRRIVVGPTLAFLGFALMAIAILWQPRSRKNHDTIKQDK